MDNTMAFNLVQKTIKSSTGTVISSLEDSSHLVHIIEKVEKIITAMEVEKKIINSQTRPEQTIEQR